MTRAAPRWFAEAASHESQWRSEDRARSGSTMLAREIGKLGAPEDVPERPALTFAEQLELVAAGKARVVEVRPIRKPDPDFTIGGVVGSINL